MSGVVDGNIFTVESLIKEGKVKSIIVDGLDGAGKGTIVDAATTILSQEGGYDTLCVKYPLYETHWGIILRHLLYEDDEGLTLDERMTVYALNRIESIYSLQRSVLNLASRGRYPLFVLFDRFVTSNVLTAAYYFAKTRKLLPSKREVDNLYLKMQNIDRYFLRKMGLEDFHVTIPVVSTSVSLDAIMADGKRNRGADLYENTSVQNIADAFYKQLSEQHPDTFALFNQVQEGRRMSGEEIARMLVGKEVVGIPQLPGYGTSSNLVFIGVDEESEMEIQRLVMSSPRLLGLDRRFKLKES